MHYLDYLQFLLGLFMPLFIGVLLYKLKIVDDNFPKSLSGYLYNIALPCSIIDSMRIDISARDLLKNFKLPVICILIILLCFVLGKIIVAAIEKNKKRRGLLIFGFMFSNFTFTAYPILENLYGKEAIFYASLFNIGMFVGSLTIGTYVIKTASENSMDTKFKIKDLFSVPFISLIAATALLFVPFKFPPFLSSSVSMLSATTAPLGIMLTGIIAAKKNSLNLKDYKAYFISAFRLLIIPVITIYILKALGYNGYMVYVPAIILCNPIAVNLVMFSENFDAPSEIGANYVVISSLLSIFTIPLIQLII